MLAIHDLTYRIGARCIYTNASLHIGTKDKIGLVGLNGAGKSTLFKLIVGDLMPDQGTISRSKDCTIGFFSQDLISYQPNDSIRSVAMQAFTEALAAQKKITSILYQMEHSYHDDLVEQLAVHQEAFEQMGGYALQSQTDTVLEGMGFATEHLDKPLSQFSGGWRMRVLLAKLLLQKPSLLLLDEPTNHLDIISIKWIENYLQDYNGAFVIASHDRSFLDQVTHKIVEVAHQQLCVYMGNYTSYEQRKAVNVSLQQRAHEKQRQKIKQTERFIERFRSKATKAKQVQSRIKSLERLDILEPIKHSATAIKFNLDTHQPGKIVATLTRISKAFGTTIILQDANAQVKRGDKIALIGANGKGKSTLLKIIAKQEPTDAGELTLGHQVRSAFYSQHQLETLHWDYTILEELQHIGTTHSENELRNVAGMFLFRKDDIFKKIHMLSGGERSRVALAKILLSAANFLLLDEPTNHLDMVSINTLTDKLKQYKGTFVLVSHDRYLVAQVATKIWYLEDFQIKEYPGTYEEYNYCKKRIS